MFGLIQTAYAQAATTATDVANKTSEFATSNWEYGLVALIGVGAVYLGYRYYNRPDHG